MLPQDLRWAHEQAAEVVVDDALPRVPFRSGRLRRSLKSSGTSRGGYAKAGGNDAPHAASIHWGRKVGNVGSPPGNHKGPNVIVGRPFLRDAAIRRKVTIIDQFEQAMEKLAEQIERS